MRHGSTLGLLDEFDHPRLALRIEVNADWDVGRPFDNHDPVQFAKPHIPMKSREVRRVDVAGQDHQAGALISDPL